MTDCRKDDRDMCLCLVNPIGSRSPTQARNLVDGIAVDGARSSFAVR